MPGASTSAALNRAVHRYRAAPLGARLFVHGRAFLSDLAFVERFVPKRGFIVDLGSGHGLFPCLLREASEQRRVLGIDLDERKIEVARGAVRDTQWLRFEVGDIIKDQPPHCDAVTIVDVLYLLPFEDQERVLRNAAAALGEGGPLIVKAQERRTDPRYAITYAAATSASTSRRARRRSRCSSAPDSSSRSRRCRAGHIPTWSIWPERLL